MNRLRPANDRHHPATRGCPFENTRLRCSGALGYLAVICVAGLFCRLWHSCSSIDLNVPFIIDHHLVTYVERTKVLIVERESNLRFINAVELNGDIVTQGKTLACAGLFRIDEICMNCIVSAGAARISADAKVYPQNPPVPTPSLFLTKSPVVGGITGVGFPPQPTRASSNSEMILFMVFLVGPRSCSRTEATDQVFWSIETGTCHCSIFLRGSLGSPLVLMLPLSPLRMQIEHIDRASSIARNFRTLRALRRSGRGVVAISLLCVLRGSVSSAFHATARIFSKVAFGP